MECPYEGDGPDGVMTVKEMTRYLYDPAGLAAYSCDEWEKLATHVVFYTFSPPTSVKICCWTRI